MGRAPVLALCFVLLGAWAGRTEAQQMGTESPHGDISLDLDCGACHTPTGWKPTLARMDFDHDRSTSFALVGRHKEAACTGCHLGARFDEPKLSNGDCSSCHVDVHLGNLSDVCVQCHNTLVFSDVAGLSIHARTTFPLAGAHLQVTCESCHVDDRGGAFSALDSDCFSCHQGDFDAAISPDHQALLFPTTCEDCHNSLAWGGGGPFDHFLVSRGFDLIGAHEIIGCENCHTVPGFVSIYQAAGENDCISCHQDDYDRRHAGSGFSVDCLGCHNVDTWAGAGGAIAENHDADFFPIFSGKHDGKWNDDCASCHTVPGNFQVFICVNCHKHEPLKTDEKHLNVDGYAYVSELCLACHPTGEKNPR